MPAKHLYRVNTEGSFHHVYNKGIEGRTIFVDDHDYETFLGFLEEYLSPPKDIASTKREFVVNGRKFNGVPHQPKNYYNKVELIAYNLTANSFNLLLHQKTNSAISDFIRSICTRYSIYYNKKYQRAGSLFEGPFKSVHLNDEAEILLLTREFHKKGGFCSYPEYLGERNTTWVRSDIGLALNKQGSYKDFVEKHDLSQNGDEKINKISVSNSKASLERRDLATARPKLKSRRTTEYAIAMGAFLLLFGLGLRNIDARSDKQIALSQLSPQVLSIFDVAQTPMPVSLDSINTYSTPAPTPIPTPTPETVSTIVPTTTVTFQAVDELGANVRLEPTTNSNVVGTLHSGDIIEILSTHKDWYKIKLLDETEGFVYKDILGTSLTI